MSERTTISLSKKTRDELAKLGRKGETYEEIIRRLMKRAAQAKVEAKGPRDEMGYL